MNKSNSDDKQLESLSALIDNHWYDDDEIAADVLASLQGQKQSSQHLRDKFERYHLVRDAMHKDVSNAGLAGFSARVAAAIADEPAIVSPAGMPRKEVMEPVGDSTYVESINASASSSADLSATMAAGPVAPSVHSLDEARREKRETDSRKSGGFWSGRVGAGVGGFAVAASAAMVALLGYNLLEQQNTAPESANGNQLALNAEQNPGNGSPTVSLSTLAQSGNAQSVLPVTAVNDQQTLQQLQNSSTANANLEYVSNTSTYWVKDSGVDAARNPMLEKRLNQLLSQHIENSPTAARLGSMLPYSRLAGYDTARSSSTLEAPVGQ